MAPVDSAGNVSRPPSPLPVTGQNADAPQVNVPLDDIYSVLNLLVFLDGRKPWRGSQNANGYKVAGAANGTDPQDYVTKAQLDAAIAAVAAIPTGAMLFLASTVVPAGWLALNGQLVSRTTFAALWTFAQASGNLAGTEGGKTVGQFGPGDGSTTFSLPNLYSDGGQFLRPISSGRGIGTVQADELKSHGHTGVTSEDGEHAHNYQARFDDVVTGGSGFPKGAGTYIAVTSFSGKHLHSLQINATGGAETRPKNIAYPVLIKT